MSDVTQVIEYDDEDDPFCEYCGRRVTDGMTAEFAPFCSQACTDLAALEAWSMLNTSTTRFFTDVSLRADEVSLFHIAT